MSKVHPRIVPVPYGSRASICLVGARQAWKDAAGLDDPDGYAWRRPHNRRHTVLESEPEPEATGDVVTRAGIGVRVTGHSLLRRRRTRCLRPRHFARRASRALPGRGVPPTRIGRSKSLRRHRVPAASVYWLRMMPSARSYDVSSSSATPGHRSSGNDHGHNEQRAYLGEVNALVRPGALGRIRTCDTGFRRAVLYPLSYEGRGL